jgi:hypothetical protein
VLRRALAKERFARTATVVEVASELAAALHGIMPAGLPPPAPDGTSSVPGIIGSPFVVDPTAPSSRPPSAALGSSPAAPPPGSAPGGPAPRSAQPFAAVPRPASVAPLSVPGVAAPYPGPPPQSQPAGAPYAPPQFQPYAPPQSQAPGASYASPHAQPAFPGAPPPSQAGLPPPQSLPSAPVAYGVAGGPLSHAPPLAWDGSAPMAAGSVVAEPPRRRTGLIVGVVAAGIIASAAVTWLVVGRGPEPGPSPPVTATPTTPAAAPPPAATPQPPAATKPETPPPVVTKTDPPPPLTIDVTLAFDVVPADAAVDLRLDGAPVADRKAQVPRSDDAHVVTAEARGFLPFRAKVVADHDRTVAVTLRRKGARPEAPQATSTPPATPRTAPDPVPIVPEPTPSRPVAAPPPPAPQPQPPPVAQPQPPPPTQPQPQPQPQPPPAKRKTGTIFDD